MGRKRKIRYEDMSDVVDQEIRKRKNKWFLDSVPWISFEDVEQIIRVHIYQKFDQWDQKRDLKPWINKIITNQFKNILRNYYLNFAKPCASCPFDGTATAENSCLFTKSGVQDNSCPLFKKWSKYKKNAHDVKIPLRLDSMEFEQVGDSNPSHFEINSCVKRVEKELKEELSEKYYEVYVMLFVDNKSEDEVAKQLGYKSNEQGRTAGYKQIKNIKKMIKEKVIKIIRNKDIIY